jgi:phage terminase large subunit-like protein
VTASRGKIVRAEPIAALFEQGRVSIVTGLTELEDQLCAMTSEGYVGGGSPDRADAMIWSLSELMAYSNRMIITPLRI